jgi:beta-glucosidase
MRYFALFLLLSFQSTAFAIYEINGKITDSGSNPISNARVILSSGPETTYTASNGTFIFKGDRNSTLYRQSYTNKDILISFDNSFFTLTTQKNMSLNIELYNLNGKSLFRKELSLIKGKNRINIPVVKQLLKNLVILKLYNQHSSYIYKLSPISNGNRFAFQAIPVTESYIASAKSDSLTIEKSTFTTVNFPVTQENHVFDPIIMKPDSIELKIDTLLSKMTRAEKIGQMAQADRKFVLLSEVRTLGLGSLLSGGGSVPTPNTPESWATMYDNYQKQALATTNKIPLIYGIDAVHGHNNVLNAVLFPHHIALGCTRNPALVEKAAHVTALEMAATGIRYTFAPCIAVARDDRWGRTYESFGETPELAMIMGKAEIRGFQGKDLSSDSSVAGCAKHFIGDGGTTWGSSTAFIIDRGDTRISEDELRKIHLPGYITAVQNDVATVMVSYSSYNGVRMHAQTELITDLLKKELGFNGFVISDWDGIDDIAPTDFKTSVKKAINAGIDMGMVPKSYKTFITDLTSLVNSGDVKESRIDDAVRRILRIKFRMGLFNKPFANRTFIQTFGSAEHRAVARECVRQSVVLLKNNNRALPLPKSGKNIAVAGVHANNIGLQCGGWSISWLGSEGPITSGTTILEGIQKAVTNSSQISYSVNGSISNSPGAAIVVIGETPYAEGHGDSLSLDISEEAISIVKKFYDAKIPVIAVIISGRPLIINSIIGMCDAVVAAWLPGTEGSGVADVLFGDYKPTGKLSVTWPKEEKQHPINIGDAVYNPLFEYGFGLTY